MVLPESDTSTQMKRLAFALYTSVTCLAIGGCLGSPSPATPGASAPLTAQTATAAAAVIETALARTPTLAPRVIGPAIDLAVLERILVEEIVVQGTGQPGATLAVRIDDAIAARVLVDDTGNWTATIQTVSPGDHVVDVQAINSLRQPDATTSKVRLRVLAATATATKSPTATATPTVMADSTPTATATQAPAPTATVTSTPTQTPIPTVTPSLTPTRLPTFTPTQIPTAAPTTLVASPVPFEIVVDDKGPGFTVGGPERSWRIAPYGYRGSTHWTYCTNQGVSNWARWSPQLSAPGVYEVSVFVPEHMAGTQRAKYRVTHNGHVEEIVVRQSDFANEWVSLGVFDFSASGDEHVYLDDNTGEPLRESVTIGFDAVKFVHLR